MGGRLNRGKWRFHRRRMYPLLRPFPRLFLATTTTTTRRREVELVKHTVEKPLSWVGSVLPPSRTRSCRSLSPRCNYGSFSPCCNWTTLPTNSSLPPPRRQLLHPRRTRRPPRSQPLPLLEPRVRCITPGGASGGSGFRPLFVSHFVLRKRVRVHLWYLHCAGFAPVGRFGSLLLAQGVAARFCVGRHYPPALARPVKLWGRGQFFIW